MEPLLFICHRIPFPPNKGDKITTFNLMKYLSERYELYLGSFIDDKHDRQYIDDVKKFCKEVYFEDICNKSQLVSGITSLIKRQPVSVQHYKSNTMQAWADTTIEKHNINNLFVYSSGLGYLMDNSSYSSKVRVLDMADVDSDKWRQYAENKSFLSSWIYKREHRLLQKLEQHYLSQFDAVTLITDEERDLFKQLSPKRHESKIVTLGNGVDTEYFNADATFDYTDSPDNNRPCISFTGAMDYWANADAVKWFCKYVWPTINEKYPDLLFYIVGGNPSEEVLRLNKLNNVIVTGRVVDVRPFVAASAVCVAPLRIARGVQNKVLEAMSMSKAVVMTKMAQEGIQVSSEQTEFVNDDAAKMATSILKLLENPELSDKLGKTNRKWIVQQYSWNGALSKLDDLFPREKNENS